MKHLTRLAYALALTACGPDAVELDPSIAPSTAASSLATAPSSSAPAGAAPANSEPRTPNELYARGTPTFVAGTLGSDHEDRVIRRQIEFIRGLLFPTAKIVDDTTIDVKAGPSAWPPNAVLYGGPQHNAVVLALEQQLPFQMEKASLKIDGHTLEDVGVQLMMLVPARNGGIAHPTFMLYAGTGPDGVAQINSRAHGENGIAIYDGFDSIAGGNWQSGTTSMVPQLNWAPPRKGLEEKKLALAHPGATANLITVQGATYEDLPAKEAAIQRALETALKKLATPGPTEVRVVLYPNVESKKRYTHSVFDGHASAAAAMLHVIAFKGDVFERLVEHEATHVYTEQLWGPPGTVLLGEGLAVWLSGQYGGTSLPAWKKKLETRTPLPKLLGAEFSRIPERETYPQAGLITGAIVDRIGVPKLRDKLWAETPATWQAACDSLGITAEELEKATR